MELTLLFPGARYEKEKTLEILGKGKGSQKEVIDLSERTTDAIASWIKASKKKRGNEPLFTVLAYYNPHSAP
ncbi:hypothetical protein [Nostoc sp.]